MHNFRKLTIWQDSIDLTVDVYKLVKQFPPEEKFNLTSQIKRSAVSVPSNIAEGAGRNSKKEFNHFLGISTGSGYELETQLIVSQRLGFIQEKELGNILNSLHSIQKRTHSFKQSLFR